MTDLTQLSASELSRRIQTGALRSVDVMDAFLDRIEALNPAINAIVSLRPRAELIAEAAELDHGPVRGWMHGLPVAVKDLVSTKGLRTTWGSPIHADHVPQSDDLVAARMRAAGAIFIGKTNTSEWGLGSHSFNPVHGTTLNPYDLTRSAGGSSGGTAAALAARLVPVADGSDMMGSLRNPAAFCNVYGYRPTWGLVPSDPGGDTHIATLSTAGPMARCPEDLARFLEVLAGPNPLVPYPRQSEPYAQWLDAPVRGCRIGWLADWDGAYPCEPGITGLCENALRVLEEAGCVIEPVSPPYPAEKLWSAWTTLRAFLNAGSKRALYDDPEQRAKLKPEAIWEIEQGLGVPAQAVYDASVTRSDYFAHMSRLFERFDVLALPSAQVWPFPAVLRHPASINGIPMDTYHRWMEIVVPVSLAGFPAVALPAGFGSTGLPTGLQIFGRSGADRAILRLGQAYHRATDWPSRMPARLGSGKGQ